MDLAQKTWACQFETYFKTIQKGFSKRTTKDLLENLSSL